MSTTTRNPTMVAECGCPYDPEYDEGSLGWHLRENHPPDPTVVAAELREIADLIENGLIRAGGGK